MVTFHSFLYVYQRVTKISPSISEHGMTCFTNDLVLLLDDWWKLRLTGLQHSEFNGNLLGDEESINDSHDIMGMIGVIVWWEFWNDSHPISLL